jgi:hypothetical protein
MCFHHTGLRVINQITDINPVEIWDIAAGIIRELWYSYPIICIVRIPEPVRACILAPAGFCIIISLMLSEIQVFKTYSQIIEEFDIAYQILLI